MIPKDKLAGTPTKQDYATCLAYSSVMGVASRIQHPYAFLTIIRYTTVLVMYFDDTIANKGQGWGFLQACSNSAFCNKSNQILGVPFTND